MRVPQRGRSRFLGRPASRSCSSTEQEPGHRGESVSDVRPILFGSSSFVGLLGSGAFMACEAREGLGSSRKSACQGVGLASRRMQRLDWGFADIFGMPRRWESACIGAKACVVSAAGTLVDAPRVRGRRRWERNAVGWSIQRVPPRAGGVKAGRKVDHLRRLKSGPPWKVRIGLGRDARWGEAAAHGAQGRSVERSE